MTYLKDIITLQYDINKCSGCTMCTIVCPHAVFEMKEKKAFVAERDRCMECGACSKNCPEGAITVRTGVGCAAGVINGIIRGTEPSCDCSGSGNSGGVCC